MITFVCLFFINEFSLFFINDFFFLWPHPWHTEGPRLGVEMELQLQAYTTATAMSDLSLICDLCCSSGQRQILNPLSHNRKPWGFLFVCLLSFFILGEGCTCGIWRFLGQGLNLSHSCDLCRSCGNTRSFNPVCPVHASGATQATAVIILTHCTTVGTPWVFLIHGDLTNNNNDKNVKNREHGK